MTTSFELDSKFLSYFDLEESSDEELSSSQSCVNLMKDIVKNYNKLNNIKLCIQFTIDKINIINNKTDEINTLLLTLEYEHQEVSKKINNYLQFLDEINMKLISDIKLMDNKNI